MRISISVPKVNAATYMETFDLGSAGWKYGYGSSYTVGTTTYHPSGGHPGGHISGNAEDLYAIWVDGSDTQVFGDMRGLTITIDTKVTGNAVGDAQLYIGRGGDYYVASSWDISLDTDWSTHRFILNESVFTHWDSSNNSFTFNEVLAAADDIGVFFGASTVTGGAGSLIAVDNFGTTPTLPEPSGLLLFGVAGVWIILLKLRKR